MCVCVCVCACVRVRAGAPAPSPPRRIVEGGTAAASAAVRGRALSVVLSPERREPSEVLIQQGRELSEVLLPAGTGAVRGAEPCRPGGTMVFAPGKGSCIPILAG